MFNNIVKLIGNLGADPKTIITEKSKFAVLSVATSDRYKDQDSSEWKSTETIWHNVIAFKPNLIEKIKDFKKGNAVKLNGILSYRPFDTTDESGKKITKYEASIIAHAVELALDKAR
jgi:single-strand DNA-binding protein